MTINFRGESRTLASYNLDDGNANWRYIYNSHSSGTIDNTGALKLLSHNLTLKVVSFNMHGFFQGLPVIVELVANETPIFLCYRSTGWPHLSWAILTRGLTVIFVWLLWCVETGILCSRWYEDLIQKGFTQIMLTTIHCDERFVIVKVYNYLFISVYLPCSGTLSWELSWLN